MGTDLRGVSVLVDAYNLGLRQGSGIKTYGLSLIRALGALHARVSLLTDRYLRRTRFAQLKPVLLYDADELVPPGPRRRSIRMIGTMRAALLGLSADYLDAADVVQDDRFGITSGVTTLLNAPDCYWQALQAHRATGRPVHLRPKSRVDIWHATYPLPLRVRGAKRVTTIHDLIPLRLPYATLDNKKIFYRLVQDAVRGSDLLLADSECTKRDLLAGFDVAAEKIAVTYLPVPPTTWLPSESLAHTTLRRYQLEAGKYVLFVGNVEPKKNVRTLIEAFGAVDSEVPLVIAGRRAWLWEDQLAAAERAFGSGKRLKRKLRLLDYVSNADLSVLYSNAACFVFPSLYEGFGLPPLEAMKHGCPVISSNAASLPEVCADAALYVNPRDPEQIRAAIEVLLSDEQKRSELIAAGYRRVQEFSMERFAQRLLSAYVSLGMG